MKTSIYQTVEFLLEESEQFTVKGVRVEAVTVSFSPSDDDPDDPEPYTEVSLKGWQVTKAGVKKKNGRWASTWGGIEVDEKWTKLATEHLKRNQQ